MNIKHSAFYKEHFENICNRMIIISSGYFRGDTVAEDEAVVKALKKLDGSLDKVIKITDPLKREGYISKLTHRVCIDIYNTRKKRPTTNLEKIQKSEEEPSSALSTRKVDLREDMKVASLTKEQQEVINLILDGYLLREIADELGKSLGSIKMLKKRAIETLKNYYCVEK